MRFKMPIFSLLLIGLGAVEAAACDTNTLKGTYIFAATGQLASGEPITYAAMASYDGKGGVLLRMRNANEPASKTVAGTYKVAKDCEGEVTFENGRTATYFIAPAGDVFTFVLTANAIVSGEVRRVSGDLLVTAAK